MKAMVRIKGCCSSLSRVLNSFEARFEKAARVEDVEARIAAVGAKVAEASKVDDVEAMIEEIEVTQLFQVLRLFSSVNFLLQVAKQELMAIFGEESPSSEIRDKALLQAFGHI